MKRFITAVIVFALILVCPYFIGRELLMPPMGEGAPLFLGLLANWALGAGVFIILAFLFVVASRIADGIIGGRE